MLNSSRAFRSSKKSSITSDAELSATARELARTQRVVAELRARLEMSANLLLEALSPRQISALGHDGAMLLSYLSGAD